MMTTSSEVQPVIVDSFAWIEYFKGSQRGRMASKIIDDVKIPIFTVDACLAELKFWALTESYPVEAILREVQRISNLLSTDSEDWLSSAVIKFEKRKTVSGIGMIDCLVIYHAKQLNAEILTGDQHFKLESNVILI